MRVCPKCSDYSADRLLAFCLADGTPMVDVDPRSDAWSEAVRVIDRRATAVREQNRKLKWKGAVLTSMLMATAVVTVAAFSRSFSVTVEKPGELCIETFNDLNGNGERNAGEPSLSGFGFEVSGTGAPMRLTTELDGRICSRSPVGMYTVDAQPNDDWIATTKKTQVTIATGQRQLVPFGFKQEAELCIEAFNDLNRSRVRNAGEPSLSGFSFQVTGSGINKTLTTELERGVCETLPVGPYTVVAIAKTGWTPTTETTRTVMLNPKLVTSVFFGNHVKEDICSDADQQREWGVIINKYGSIWREPISIEHTFPIGCMTAVVTITYESKVMGAVPVRKQQRYECAKTGTEWNCSAIRSRAETSVTFQAPRRTPN